MDETTWDAVSTRGPIGQDGLASLTPQELAEVLADRVVIEQAKGMLMTIYGIDEEQAFDLLKVRSQVMNVKVRTLARHLTQELPALSTEGRLPSRADYDRVLQRPPAG